jgi:DNA-binding transcriptional LysR family regulator
MNDFWHMEQQQRLRQQDLMHEAEQSRLASAETRKRTVRIVAPVMFRVGSVLVKWGAQLQAQYQDATVQTPSSYYPATR